MKIHMGRGENEEIGGVKESEGRERERERFPVSELVVMVPSQSKSSLMA